MSFNARVLNSRGIQQQQTPQPSKASSIKHATITPKQPVKKVEFTTTPPPFSVKRMDYSGSVKQDEDDESAIHSIASAKFIPRHAFKEEDRIAIEIAREASEEAYRKATSSHQEGLQEAEAIQNKMIQKYKTDLDGYLNHSAQICAIHTEPFVPDYVTNLNRRNIWVIPTKVNGTKVSFQETLLIEKDLIPKSIESHSGLLNGMTVFGSTHSYAQGINIPISEEPIGELTNAFLLEVKISDVVNEHPFWIGVTLTHEETGTKNEKKPLGNATHYSPIKNENYHFLIPPKSNNNRPQSIYWSSYTINNENAKQYTWMTSDKKILEREVEPFDRHLSIPVIHPVAKRYFEICHLFQNWEPLQLHPTRQERFVIDRARFNYIAEELSKEIQNSVPIVDLKTLRVQLQVLDPRPEIAKKTPVFETENGERVRMIENYADPLFYFCLQMTWCFRDFYSPESEEEEEANA